MAVAVSSQLQQNKNRKRKQLESLRNSDISESNSEADYDSCHGSSGAEEEQQEEDEAEDVVINMPGRLAGRVKRIINQNKQTGEDTDDGENVDAERFAQILDGKVEEQRNVSLSSFQKLKKKSIG